MKAKEPEIIRGSGNVYRDFGDPDADVKQLKAILTAEIIRSLDRLGMTVRKAHAKTGIAVADFSRIRNADLGRFTVDRLTTIINRLGSSIDVKVSGPIPTAYRRTWRQRVAVRFLYSARTQHLDRKEIGMTQLAFDLPESAFSALRLSPQEFAAEMRLAAAVQWYAERRISQGKAAEIAGLSRAEFLDELRRRRVSALQTDIDELRGELNDA